MVHHYHFENKFKFAYFEIGSGHVDRFRRNGLLKANAKAYATHISHEGYMEHDELEEYAEVHGYRVAFDGLALSFSV